MKKLLTATDLSARSDRALERAVLIACESSTELIIVHVVDEGLPAGLANAQAAAAKMEIRDYLSRLAPDRSEQISIHVEFGKAHETILALSETTEADLVVLGMHRESMLKDMFRGTTVERIVRFGNIPTLLVRDRVSRPYHRVIAGVDFSVYSRRAVEFAVTFIPHGEFHLVHAYDVPFKGFLRGVDAQREVSKHHQIGFEKMIEEAMASFLSNRYLNQPKLEQIMEEGMVRDVLQRQISRLAPDLLVIGTHGRTGVAHALLGSVAEDLLRDPPCDVLAVKAW